MGVVKRGIFKRKGSGKGVLWESSRQPLHLAYAYDPKDPLQTLESMLLRAAPCDVPSLEGVYHRGYDVNLYRMEKLPPRSLMLRSRDTATAALEAFDAGLKVVRDGLRQREVYIIRRREGGSTMYCEVKMPDRSGKVAYTPVLSTRTEKGVWRIFLMDFDKQHVDCRRALPNWWQQAEDLEGLSAVKTAFRYALQSSDKTAAACSFSAASDALDIETEND